MAAICDTNGILRKHVDYDSFGQVTEEVFYDAAGTAIPGHPIVNFGGGALVRYAPGVQDIDNSVSISPSGQAVTLSGNTWQAVEVNYTLTPNTVLEFDFYSSVEGEVEGFAFDSDLTLTNPDVADLFHLYGTQNDASWLQHAAHYEQYDAYAGTTQHYVIPVGEFLAAGFRRYFVLVNDNDVNSPQGNALFQNVQLYEQTGLTPPPSHAEAVDQLFYYQGQQRDGATGLQKHGERWYDPFTGRWRSEDPTGFDGGDPNLYRAFGNSPDNFTDPTGTTQAGNPLNNLNTGGLNSYSTPKAVDQYYLNQNLKNYANPLSAGTHSFTTPSYQTIQNAHASEVLRNANQIYARADLGSIKPSGTHDVGIGDALRDSGGYWHGVGEVVKGYGDAVVGTATGLYNVARHPINTAKGVATAIRHPILTGQAIYNDVYDKSQTLRGQGSLVGDVLIGVASGGTAKAVKEAGLVGKITSKLGTFVDDTPTNLPRTLEGLRTRVDTYANRAQLAAFDKGLSGAEAGNYADRYFGKAVSQLDRRLVQAGGDYRILGQYGRDVLGGPLAPYDRPAGSLFLDAALTDRAQTTVFSGWDTRFQSTPYPSWNTAAKNASYVSRFHIQEGFVREISVEARRP